MTRITTALAISLDGYIAGPNDGPGNPLGDGGGRLFDWYFSGHTPSPLFPSFQLSEQSAMVFNELAARIGAVISGRRTYEISNAWGGQGPVPRAPLFVMTHTPPTDPPASDPPYTFVTTGIADAIKAARAAAEPAGRDVGLMGSAPVQQAIREGLLDVLALHVVPVLLGGGVRLLDGVHADLRLAQVLDAPGVTHLVYEVIR